MTAPYAEVYERDESGYINSEQSVNTYIASWAPCGPVGTQLVPNAKTFYKRYTPKGQYQSGYPVAFLNAEACFNINSPVWFNRVVPEDALYGGAVVTVGNSVPSYSLPQGISSPDAFIFAEATTSKTNEQISILCKADSNGSLGGTYFYLPGGTEFVYIKNNARAEQVDITCIADTAGSLGGTYFILPTKKHYVWFNINSESTNPGEATLVLSGLTGIEANIQANATAIQVASAVNNAVRAISTDYISEVSDAIVTVTCVTKGVVEHGNAGTTGFSYLTTILGVNESATVSISGLTALEALISADATAEDVATAINAALANTANFTCAIQENNSAKLVVTNKAAGYVDDARDGERPTNFVFTTLVQGSNQAGSEAMLFYTADPNALDISYRIYSHQDNPTKAPEAGTFVVAVYKDGILENEFTCSRVQDKKDGNGQPLYVEQALLASSYLRCRDNVNVADTELPVSSASAVKLTGGTPGTNATPADMIRAVQPWRNRDDFDITLIMVGGFTDPAYTMELDNIAKARGDCAVINSIPYYVENTSEYLQNVVNYRKNDLNINSSYIATFSSSLHVFNSGLNKNVYIPSDGHVAGAIINAARNYEIFYPILGFKRGILSNVLDVKHRYTREEMDELYANQINPIRFVPGRGIVIWGQKTMQSSSSSLDRLNARLLLCSIKPQLQEFLEDNIGELNTDETRDKITLLLNGLFDTYLAKQGILAYEVACDPIDSNNPNKLTVNVRLQITPGVEYVDLTITLEPVGVSFS